MEIESTNQPETYYIGVFLYKSSSDSPNYKPLYEETIVLLRALSIEDAKKKALFYAEQKNTTYKNEYNETITWSLEQVIDVNSVLDDEMGDGAQLYSRHFRNYKAYKAFEPLLSNEFE